MTHLMRMRVIPSRGFARRAFLLLVIGLSGCAAMTQDVDQYYRQMADNFKEAEERTKVQIANREREANMLLKGNEVHDFKRAMREVNRLKNWQEHCVRERERFVKAAEKLEASSRPAAEQGQGPTTPNKPAS